MNTDSLELLSYIQKKEAQEKKRRHIRMLIFTGFALSILATGVFGWPVFKAKMSAELEAKGDVYQTAQKIALRQQNQQLYPETIGEKGPFIEVDKMPLFPGGEPALFRFLSHQIRYPDLAAKQRLEGNVLVRFVIHPDGSIGQAEVVQGIGMGCDEEALRVIRNMPNWIAGERDGEAVSVYSSLAVNFKFLP